MFMSLGSSDKRFVCPPMVALGRLLRITRRKRTMLKQYMKWAILMAVMHSLILAACAPPATPTEEAAPTDEAAA